MRVSGDTVYITADALRAVGLRAGLREVAEALGGKVTTARIGGRTRKAVAIPRNKLVETNVNHVKQPQTNH